MENGLGIAIFAIITVISLIVSWSASSSAIDPENSDYATSHNISAKLASHIDSNALYTVYVVRQSGNYERGYENVRGYDVAGLITPTLKRAKIDAVAISQRSKYLSVYRTMHNHRGRNEGKKIGGFRIIKQAAA